MDKEEEEDAHIVDDKVDVSVSIVGLGNISIYHQYRNTGVCNN